MDGQVSLVIEVAVKPGPQETFRVLMQEMVAATRADPAPLDYQWFVGDDGSVVHLFERYADSAATQTLLANFGERFAGWFLAAVDPTGFTVMGSRSDEVRAALSGFGPTVPRPFGGFTR
jgi:quinol monooxygenase YgiN